MKGKTIRKLTAEQYIKIPVITWRNYREETRHESNPHLAPRLPWTAMNMLSKSWEIPHPHGLTMPSNTIKIPHIAPHRPGVGGVGVSIDKCISFTLNRPQSGLPCDRADRACNSNITADHFYSVSTEKPIEIFNLKAGFNLGNLRCCSSFTGNKIVSYIKPEDGPVFTVYSEVRYVAKHCHRLKLTRYSCTYCMCNSVQPYSDHSLHVSLSLMFRFPSHQLFVWNSMKWLLQA